MVLRQPVHFYVQGCSTAWAQRGLFLEKKRVLWEMNVSYDSLCIHTFFHLIFQYHLPYPYQLSGFAQYSTAWSAFSRLELTSVSALLHNKQIALTLQKPEMTRREVNSWFLVGGTAVFQSHIPSPLTTRANSAVNQCPEGTFIQGREGQVLHSSRDGHILLHNGFFSRRNNWRISSVSLLVR